MRKAYLCFVIVSAVLILASIENTAQAQGLFFTGQVGYGLSAGSQFLGLTHNQSVRLHEGVYGSYGAGIKFGGSLGIMFRKNVGVEFAGIFSSGKSFEWSDFDAKQTTTASGRGIELMPSLIVAIDSKNVQPYARLGLVLGLVKAKFEMNTNTPGNIRHLVTEDNGGMSIGYVGGLGVIFSLSKNLGFFVEGQLVNMTYSPSQMELKEYTINGQDQMSTVQRKTRDYKDSYTATTDVNVQDPMPGIRHPFGNFGVQAGIRLMLPM